MTAWQTNGLTLGFALVVLFASGIIWSVATAEPVDSTALSPELLEGADPEAGEEKFISYGCGTCHTIDGLAAADGTVGPPLTDFALRDYIAGNVINTPDNLVRWIIAPDAIEPGTAMPIIGVTQEDARDIAAYLYTLD